MSAPLFYVSESELSALSADSPLHLGGAEGKHAATVRRISSGESVEVADGAGRRALCTVVGATTGSDAGLDLRVLSVTDEPAPRPELVLVQALAKDGRDEQAVETATELGVDAVIPWHAERSIVRWRPERREKSLAKWRNVVYSAAKQSRRARIPEVENLVSSRDLAHVLGQPGAAGVVLHERAEQPLWARLHSDALDAEQILLIVGPEGGISEAELDMFAQAGAQQYLLGPHVLRASTAGPTALALASVALGRWH